MEEDFDFGWIIPLLFFFFFFVWPVIRAVRKGMAEAKQKLAENPQLYEQLMAQRQAELQRQHQPKKQNQLTPSEQKRRAEEKKRRRQAQQADAEAKVSRLARAARRDADSASLESQLTSLEADAHEAAYDWGAQTSLESTAPLVSESVEAQTASLESTVEGRSLLVNLEQAAAEDFAEPKRSTEPSLAQRLRHPQTLREVLVAGEIFRRPE